MGLLRNLFGPSRKEVWREFSSQIGAQYIEGGFWKGDKVQARHGQWTVTVDTYTESHSSQNQNHSRTYTRLRAPYVSRDGFRFTIYRNGMFSELGKLLGMQDVEVGFPEFDAALIIKGNDEAKLRALFANERVRRLIEMQANIHLEVKDNEGWFGPGFPDAVDELYFHVGGVIKDIDRLKSLYYLFAETLSQLCQIGSAGEDDPGVEL